MPQINYPFNSLSTRVPFDYCDPIASCSPKITEVDASTYKYVVEFFTGAGEKHSERSYIIKTPANSPGRKDRKVIDVYSQNGTATPTPEDLLQTGLFTPKDIEGIQNAAEKLSREENHRLITTIMVLDLKDPQGMYDNYEAIRASEDAVGSLIGSEKPKDLNGLAKKACDIFQRMPLTYLFREGSLKAHLSEHLSEEQRQFFLQRGANGRRDFCEYAETLISAMKNGHEVQGMPPSKDFFMGLRSKEPFIPAENQDTWYPGPYRDLYGSSSRVLEVIRKSRYFPPMTFIEDNRHEITCMSMGGQR